MVDTDRIRGAAREFGGRAQDAAGARAGVPQDRMEGRVREAQGSAETLYGRAKHAVDEAADHAADAYDQGRRYLWEGHEQSVRWPHASLIAAGLVGFGLGLVVSRI